MKIKDSDVVEEDRGVSRQKAMNAGLIHYLASMANDKYDFLFKNHQGIEGATNKKGNSVRRHNRMISSFNRFVQQKHSHKQEAARRVKQIEKGMLTVHNGLTT